MRRFIMLSVLWATATFGGELDVRGDVIDSEGAAIGRATLRLLASDTRLTLRRCQTDEYGRFDFGSVPRGQYVIAASASGFRERLLPLWSLRPEGEPVRIQLNVVGCDHPGVNCDIFTTGPYSEPHPVRAKGPLQLRPSDAVDLDSGEVKASSNAADIVLQNRGPAGLYLAPINRARIVQLGAADASCTRGKYEREPMRIDGLGAGADICVMTNSGGRSQLFISEEVLATSEGVKLYFVTRRR